MYHAQANPTERVNRLLKTMIVAFVRDDHKDWDLHLHEFRFAYNTTLPLFFSLLFASALFYISGFFMLEKEKIG